MDKIRRLSSVEVLEETTGKKRKSIASRVGPDDVDRPCADLARSVQELGYLPGTTLREGLARQWQWNRFAPLVKS